MAATAVFALDPDYKGNSFLKKWISGIGVNRVLLCTHPRLAQSALDMFVSKGTVLKRQNKTPEKMRRPATRAGGEKPNYYSSAFASSGDAQAVYAPHRGKRRSGERDQSSTRLSRHRRRGTLDWVMRYLRATAIHASRRALLSRPCARQAEKAGYFSARCISPPWNKAREFFLSARARAVRWLNGGLGI